MAHSSIAVGFPPNFETFYPIITERKMIDIKNDFIKKDSKMT